MDISASLVKELREISGAGMMDCKKVLVEANGDIDAAVILLKERGLAKAAKKAGRVASEGTVTSVVSPEHGGMMMELNCETDFAAKNDGFKELTKEVAAYFVKNGKEEGVVVDMQDKYYDETIEKLTTDAIAKIGENIKPRRFIKYGFKGSNLVHSYIHMGGKIGVMVDVEADSTAALSKPEVVEMADDIAMHIAAMNPVCVSTDEFPADKVEAEKAIFRVQVLEMGKPENMVDKIVEGKVKKFIAEGTLLNQTFVKNQDVTVNAHVADISKKIGSKLTVKRFVRFELGEGIEKKKDNFADEVASQIKK